MPHPPPALHNLTRRLDGSVTRQDEIGDLARDFNTLIAERQQSVEALRRSTQLLDNIVENIPVAIQLKAVEDDFRFVMWNKAAEMMFAVPGECMIGRTVRETWSAEDIARYREADLLRFRYLNANAERLISKPAGQAIGRLLCELFPTQRGDGHFDKYTMVVKTGIPLDEEYTTNAEGVTATWLHHQVVRLEDGIAVTTRDISARKAAEEELRSNRTFLQSLIDNLPMAISVKDVRPEHYSLL